MGFISPCAASYAAIPGAEVGMIQYHETFVVANDSENYKTLLHLTLFLYLCVFTDAKLLRLGKKKNNSFVLRSTFRNFAA